MTEEQLYTFQEQCSCVKHSISDINKYSDYADNFPAHYREFSLAIKGIIATAEMLQTKNARLRAQLEKSVSA